MPPTTAVVLYPGLPDDTFVSKGTIITFNNVNLTIRSIERIPVGFLNFSIFKETNDQLIAHVRFSIDSTIVSQSPSETFSVTNITNIDALPYTTGGYGYGYDENEGTNYSFGYGYGYSGSETTDINILYTITYETHIAGTFYAKLFVNASTHTYASDESTTFTVTTGGGGNPSSNTIPIAEAGGPYSEDINEQISFDGSGSTDVGGLIVGYRWDWTNDGTYDTSWSTSASATHTYTVAGTYIVSLQVKDDNDITDTDIAIVTVTMPPGTNVSQENLNLILTEYGVHLTKSFYANDTNSDGVFDTFTDPNHLLTMVYFAKISDHAAFLISTNGDNVPEFFWDTITDTITPVHHDVGAMIDLVNNTDTKTIILTISVEKVNWTYIEVVDLYPYNLDVTVKTIDGRTISSEMIWREGGKIFILDDPVTEYLIIYNYAEGSLFDVTLELTPDSVHVGADVSALITLINVGEPGMVNGTVSYTLYQGEEIIWSSEENVSVLGQTTYTKTISTDGLSLGSYTYSVVYNYGSNQTANAQGMFTVEAVQQPFWENILLWAVIIIIFIIIVIIAVLYKLGYLYFIKKEK